jgi:hypothetical protein
METSGVRAGTSTSRRRNSSSSSKTSPDFSTATISAVSAPARFSLSSKSGVSVRSTAPDHQVRIAP